MLRFLMIVVVSGAFAPSSFAAVSAERDAGSAVPPAAATAPAGSVTSSESPSAAPGLSPLPALPRGRSTVIGGVIRDVDPVRDQMTLKVYGGHAIKVLFDERTQVYRDGVRTLLSDLRPEDHASVETVLDGTDVFAESVHMLSQSPQGECQGQVLAFDPRDGELTVRNTLSGEPIKLRIQPTTTIARTGQESSSSEQQGISDLMRGALVSVTFESDNAGGGIAHHIAILATPGSAFEFSGRITYLDMHAGILGLVDPRDEKTYTISFNPSRFPVSQNLHQGTSVLVKASFDGTHYVANTLNIN